MVIFTTIFFKIFGALLTVLLGFMAGKWGNVKKDGIASLLFYFVAPIVYFAIPASASLKVSDLGITLVSFIIASCLSCFAFWSYSKLWKNNRVNILAFSAGTCNCGYLGIPIAAMIFDEHTLSIFALATIGVAMYEAVVGFYFCSRSNANVYDSIIKIIRLPILNASIIGCAIGLSDFSFPDFLGEFISDMRSTFALLGMVLIGLALANAENMKFNYKFAGATFFSKFIIYPLAFNAFIIADRFFLGWYGVNYHNALQLLCLMPLATSTILLSSLFKLYPEEMAASVLLAMLSSLIYIPAMSSFLLNDIVS